MIKYYQLGKKVFTTGKFLDFWHTIVFMVRAFCNSKEVQILEKFFQETPFRQNMIKTYPVLFAQLTRKFFYRNSKLIERLDIITQTVLTMESKFTEQALRRIYFDGGIRLWSEEYKQQILSLDLLCCDSERREGLLTLALRLDGKNVYHVNFWFWNKNCLPAFYIGALQGSRDGLDINKELTKHFFGYRPKNLIIYALRIMAQGLGMQGIYAISDYGFYTNNHLRLNHKLKTSLDQFWQEIDGSLCQDRRFYSLPVVESRKSLEDVVSHKRNLYRKRFAVLDTLEAEINNTLFPYLKTESADRL